MSDERSDLPTPTNNVIDSLSVLAVFPGGFVAVLSPTQIEPPNMQARTVNKSILCRSQRQLDLEQPMKCPEIITRGMLTRKFREKAREPERGLFAPTGHLFARALGNDVSAGRRDFFGAVMGRRARRTARRPPARLVPSRAKIPPVVRQQRKDTSIPCSSVLRRGRRRRRTRRATRVRHLPRWQDRQRILQGDRRA